MEYPRKGTYDVSIVICGEAGQGIQTVEKLLVNILKRGGYHVFSTKEYMSRVRGGSNSTTIRVSDRPIRSFVKRIDILIPLSKQAVDHVGWRLDEDTGVLFDEDLAGTFPEGYGLEPERVSFLSKAKDIGNKVYTNIVAAGMITRLFGVEKEVSKSFLEQTFSDKSEKVVNENVEALSAGYDLCGDLIEKGSLSVDLKPNEDVKEDYLIKGIEGVAYGAVAGGCDFISSYPMSPSTGVLVQLANLQKRFAIIAEQAEDEISAINMAIGAWYAGGRGMVTTSGGGLALMTEGISLSGMLETPAVIHLAQRPGPATGLPTRTEQGDLLMTLFAGHGDFPRAIYAPGNIEQAFDLTRHAFNIADKYQSPAFVLTDQFLVDSFYNVKELDLKGEKISSNIIESDADYVRYEDTESGISPRAIPGYGEGLVSVDSDEHDQEGHITEDLQQRISMVNKRMRKNKGLTEESIPPGIIGPKNAGKKVICWGSNYHPVKEAVERLGMDDTAVVHFSQVYPLHADSKDILENADLLIGVENNATGQFCDLLKLELGIDVEKRILKYNGLPFHQEELVERLGEILGSGGDE